MNKQLESGLHLPAEWHSCEYVMLAWPHEATDWSYMLDEITECYVAMAEAIIPYAKLFILADDENIPKKLLAHLPESRITYYKYLTNDTWIRDYGY